MSKRTSGFRKRNRLDRRARAERAVDKANVHGPNEPCTCDGCWACKGHEVGCTCDIDWDELRESRL